MFNRAEAANLRMDGGAAVELGTGAPPRRLSSDPILTGGRFDIRTTPAS